MMFAHVFSSVPKAQKASTWPEGQWCNLAGQSIQSFCNPKALIMPIVFHHAHRYKLHVRILGHELSERYVVLARHF